MAIQRHQAIVFLFLFIGYAFYILCRRAFGFIIPTFIEAEHLKKEDLGIVVSSLNTAYAISKFVIGVLSDQVSPRFLFTCGLLSSGLTVVSFSYVHSIPSYTFLWFINGLAQGCGWPACAKLLRQWFRPSQFGTMWSILSASVNVTGALVPLCLPFVLNLGNGWRSFMLISGSLSIVTAVMSFALIRDSPSDCGLPNVAESKKKDDGKPTSAPGSGKWSTLLANSFLWRLSFYYFVVFLAKTSVENWAQLLILEEKRLSIATASGFLSSFEMGGMISSFVTGYVTDWVIHKQGPNKSVANPRMKVVTGYMLISVLALLLIASTKGFLPLLAFILGASLYGNINIFGIVATEEAPMHLSGSSHAVASLAANVGAVLAGYPFSVLATSTSLTFAFYLEACLCLVCSVALFLTRSSSTKIAHAD